MSGSWPPSHTSSARGSQGCEMGSLSVSCYIGTCHAFCTFSTIRNTYEDTAASLQSLTRAAFPSELVSFSPRSSLNNFVIFHLPRPNLDFRKFWIGFASQSVCELVYGYRGNEPTFMCVLSKNMLASTHVFVGRMFASTRYFKAR